MCLIALGGSGGGGGGSCFEFKILGGGGGGGGTCFLFCCAKAMLPANIAATIKKILFIK